MSFELVIGPFFRGDSFIFGGGGVKKQLDQDRKHHVPSCCYACLRPWQCLREWTRIQ